MEIVSHSKGVANQSNATLARGHGEQSNQDVCGGQSGLLRGHVGRGHVMWGQCYG